LRSQRRLYPVSATQKTHNISQVTQGLRGQRRLYPVSATVHKKIRNISQVAQRLRRPYPVNSKNMNAQFTVAFSRNLTRLRGQRLHYPVSSDSTIKHAHGKQMNKYRDNL
jgi:hypothetical protein